MADLGRQLADLLYGESQQPKETTGQKIARRLTGAGETAATIGTGLLGSVPAGLAGLTQLIPTRGRAPDVNRAAQKVEDVQSALTYLPRTETGQRYLQNTAGALETLGAPAEYLGEKALQYTGSPGVATAANVLLDPVNFIGLPGSGKATVAATKAAGRAAMAAPRAAGDILSEALTPASRFESQRGAINLGGQFEPQSTLGLVSRADQAAAALPRQKGTGAEFLRELQKTPGVSPAELEDRGLTAALSSMGKVTKNDFLKALEDNPPVKFEEVQLGGREPWRVQLDLLENRGIWNLSPEEKVEYQRLMDRRIEEGLPAEEAPAKFQDYSIPGGENYREILLTLPTSKSPTDAELASFAKQFLQKEFDAKGEMFADSQQRIDDMKSDIFAWTDLWSDAAKEHFNLEDWGFIRPGQKRESKSDYRTPHWNQPNVLAHARISDRTGPNGEKILHVEEVQSDWHQQGRKGGYKTGKEEDQIKAINKEYDRLTARRRELYKQAEEMPDGGPEFIRVMNEANDITPQLMRLQTQADELRMASREGVPDAPFKKNWHELMMRRLVNYAAENGYDRIAITPGAEQVSRYDLSKQVDEIVYRKNQDGSYTLSAYGLSREPIINDKVISEKELENYVGKEIAAKISQNEGEFRKGRVFEDGSKSEDRYSLSGEGLQVGGEGMKGFYDKIIPTYLNTLGKPYGSKVTQDNLYKPDFDIVRNNAARHYGEGSEAYNEAIRNMTIPVHSFAITPQMREAIKSKGLPLYKKGGSVRISDNPDTMRLELATGGAVKMVAGGLTAAKGAAKAGAKGAAKAVKEEKLSVPYNIPRAPAKTKEEIRPIAQRMAEQMTGEFVRPDPKVSKNPAGKTYQQFLMEKELEGHHQYRKTKDVPEPEAADIEKQQGMVKFGISGDTTMADTELLRAGPYQMEDAVPLHGGPRFPLGGEGAWASNNPIAANVQRRIGEMSQFFDAPVLGQYMAMGPAGSMFAQHLADANLQAIDLSKMTKSQIEQFNKLIREGNEKSGPRPTFPGIQDKNEAYLWMAFDPKLRIHFNELMQKPTVTGALNLPDGRIILDAVTEPELRNKEIMTSGLSQFQFDPNVRPEDLSLSMHPTYTHLIPMKQGAPVTRTRYPTPAELEFSDVANFIRQNYPAKEFTRTMQTSSPRQLIDQQAIDEIKMFEEFMKQYTGKKKGGAVKKQAGGAIKAAAKAVKPSAEQAAKMASQQAEMALKNRAMQELKAQFEDLPLGQQPQGWMSPERLQQKIEEIRRREATPAGGQIPLLKKGGQVKFTGNLDAMRLAVQKRK